MSGYTLTEAEALIRAEDCKRMDPSDRLCVTHGDWSWWPGRAACAERPEVADVAADLLARVNAARELHYVAVGTGDPLCDVCIEPWPCPTIKALEAK